MARWLYSALFYHHFVWCASRLVQQKRVGEKISESLFVLNGSTFALNARFRCNKHCIKFKILCMNTSYCFISSMLSLLATFDNILVLIILLLLVCTFCLAAFATSCPYRIFSRFFKLILIAFSFCYLKINLLKTTCNIKCTF